MVAVGVFVRARVEDVDEVATRLDSLEGVSTFELEEPGAIGVLLQEPDLVPASTTVETGTVAFVQAEVAAPEFSDNAFPPTLPTDENHADGWLREDCLLCHESGISNAPDVRHAGMSRLLLSARCRTCHVVMAPGTAEEGEVFFSRSAFPPTMPTDESHSGAWLRDDCLLCHQNGVDGAPRVLHFDMTPALLDARCRSCHLPRVQPVEADLQGK